MRIKLFNKYNESHKNTWESKFENIYNFYLKNKNNYNLQQIDLPQAEVKDDSFYVSIGTDSQICFYGDTKGKLKYKVVDFDIADYSDIDSDEGVYPISISNYELYRKKCQDISDWLDKISEQNKGKSDLSVNSYGELNDKIDDTDIIELELNREINKHFKNFLNKSFEFELSYHLWTSSSENELHVDRFNLIVKKIEFKITNRIFCNLFVNDPYGGESYIWIESDSPYEYFDFESHKWPYFDNRDSYLKMNKVRTEMSRKEEREDWSNKKYPLTISYDATPSSYNSIKMLKEIIDLLKILNEKI